MKGWSITIIFFGSYVVFSMIYFAIFGFSLKTLQLQIQFSARSSFLIFIISFSAYPLFKILSGKALKWLVVNRKYFGVLFAFIHIYHLCLIIIKNYVFEPVFSQLSMPTLLVGIVTYSFIGLMLITSFPSISKHLDEKNWPRLHTIGGYLILSVFTILYYHRTTQELKYLPLLIIALIVWILRLIFKKFIRSQN